MMPPECVGLNRHRVAHWVAEAGGTRKGFFAQVQSFTNLTRAHQAGRSDAQRPTTQMASGRYGFIGDSIVGEIRSAFELLAPAAQTVFFQLPSVSLHPSIVGQAPMSSLPESRRTLHHAMRSLLNCSLDALFVGGFGLHRLRRDQRFQPHGLAAAQSLYTFHKQFVRANLLLLECLAKQTRAPIVFVGMQTLDTEVLLLDPPKHDWYNFFPPSVAAVWASAERDLEHERKWTLHFMRPSELATACPGVRCDGMHFASRYAEYGCYSSAHLWSDWMLPELLQRLQGAGQAGGRSKRVCSRAEWDVWLAHHPSSCGKLS